METLAQKANHNFDDGSFELFDEVNNIIYYENSSGYWIRSAFNKYGLMNYQAI